MVNMGMNPTLGKENRYAVFEEGKICGTEPTHG
jgi:hypothetical protein